MYLPPLKNDIFTPLKNDIFTPLKNAHKQHDLRKIKFLIGLRKELKDLRSSTSKNKIVECY